jgi:hypothetical protein
VWACRFVGYFDSKLYGDVHISTYPKTETPGMFSWFPIYFPVTTPIHVPAGRKVRFLGDAKSSLGDAKSSLGDATSSLGDATSLLGDAESSLGDAKSSLGDAKSSLGDAYISGEGALLALCLLVQGVVRVGCDLTHHHALPQRQRPLVLGRLVINKLSCKSILTDLNFIHVFV